MNNQENIQAITITELHEKIHSLDDHTILTVILAPPEGGQVNVKTESL